MKILKMVQHEIGCTCGRCDNTMGTALEEIDIPVPSMDGNLPAIPISPEDVLHLSRQDLADLQSRLTTTEHERDRLKQKLELLEGMSDALSLILPLAKGYAAEHPVGSNQEYVNEAAAILSRYDQDYAIADKGIKGE